MCFSGSHSHPVVPRGRGTWHRSLFLTEASAQGHLDRISEASWSPYLGQLRNPSPVSELAAFWPLLGFPPASLPPSPSILKPISPLLAFPRTLQAEAYLARMRRAHQVGFAVSGWCWCAVGMVCSWMPSTLRVEMPSAQDSVSLHRLRGAFWPRVRALLCPNPVLPPGEPVCLPTPCLWSGPVPTVCGQDGDQGGRETNKTLIRMIAPGPSFPWHCHPTTSVNPGVHTRPGVTLCASPERGACIFLPSQCGPFWPPCPWGENTAVALGL